MNKKSPFIKWMTIAFVLARVAIGFGIASFVYKMNIYVARGILGLAFIYLLYREYRFISRDFDDPLDELYTFPYYFRFFVITLGLSFFLYFGVHEISQLVIFVIRSFVIKSP